MVCGCRECGTLMVQETKGEDSRCVCPQCGEACRVCLGYDRPRSKEELRLLFGSDWPEGKER